PRAGAQALLVADRQPRARRGPRRPGSRQRLLAPGDAPALCRQPSVLRRLPPIRPVAPAPGRPARDRGAREPPPAPVRRVALRRQEPRMARRRRHARRALAPGAAAPLRGARGAAGDGVTAATLTAAGSRYR